MEEECVVCAERIDGVERLYAFGACNHGGVCSLCYLRLRSLVQIFSCPICKTELESVVCSSNPSHTFQSFTIWGENAGPGMRCDHKSKMFFPNEYYTTKVAAVWSCRCKLCDAWKRDIKTLSKHVSTEHDNQYLMCNLCIENKKVFPSEQKIYTRVEYENHLRNGGEDGFEGHPKCEFCKKRYYDKDALFFHLQKDHFTCHLCEKAGIRYRYYNDYTSLEEHFRKEHILCEESECLQKKFIVFSDPIDHAAHMLNFHPHIQVNRSIPVQFRTRRDDFLVSEIIDSVGGFGRSRGNQRAILEGGMGGRNVGGEWQVELPDAARDPRELMRERQRANPSEEAKDDPFKTTGLEYRPEDYPALVSEDITDSKPLWIGRSGGQQQNRMEQFPALSTGGKGTAVSGQAWAGPIRVSKKLTVVKNKNQSQPPKSAAGGTKGAPVVGLHPQPKPTPVPKPAPTPKPTQKSSPQASVATNQMFSATEELTLAEKIKKEMVAKPPTPVEVPARMISPAPKIQEITPPVVTSSAAYPALPGKSEQTAVRPSSVRPNISGPAAVWGAIGADAPKSGKTGSGISLAKPKFKKNEPSREPSPAIVDGPPPGFILLDNEPPPGFFTPSTNSPVSDQAKSAPPIPETETSNSKFPGGWVSIGGSGGSKQSNTVQIVSSDPADYPALPVKSTSQNKGNGKKNKSKTEVRNELQNLAFRK